MTQFGPMLDKSWKSRSNYGDVNRQGKLAKMSKETHAKPANQQTRAFAKMAPLLQHVGCNLRSLAMQTVKGLTVTQGWAHSLSLGKSQISFGAPQRTECPRPRKY